MAPRESGAAAGLTGDLAWQRAGRCALPYAWVGQTARMAARDGVDLAGPLRALGVEASDGPADDRGLDPAECMVLCMLLVNAVDDELHGLTRSRMSRGTVSMGAKAIASATTLGGAITTLCRFYDMIGGVCRFSLRREGDDAVLAIATERGERDQRALIEELLAHSVHIQLSHAFGALLPLSCFGTSTPHHPAIGRTHPYLLCPVEHGRVSFLRFPAALLLARSHTAPVDYPLWEASRFWLARHPATRDPLLDGDVDRPASSALLALLKRADLSIRSCSEELHLGLDDLRRHLHAEGTSFRQIRRTALVERARPHLHEGCSMDDLALALGYSDARSFRRALKLATGLGIAELRRDAVRTPRNRAPLMNRLREEMVRLD